MNPMTKVFRYIIPGILSLLILSACGDDKEPSKSMEQLQTENGIPVKIDTVSKDTFKQYVSFFGKVSGIRQTTVGAMTGGRIEKVNAKVGQSVKKDQVIIEFPDDLPSSQITQAKASFENAERTYDRMKKLLEAGETSQANFDNAETQYLVSKRNYESVKQTIYVEAPYDGVITGLSVNQGESVKSETPLFTIANLSRMKVVVWVSDTEIGKVKNGAEAVITYRGEDVKGHVAEKALSLDPQHQAFRVEVVFDNNEKLMAGVTVDVKILTYKNEDAIVLQRNLVQSDNNGEYVYFAKDTTAKKQYIKTVNQYDIYYEVSEGLKEGDIIISEGATKVTDGDKINVIQ